MPATIEFPTMLYGDFSGVNRRAEASGKIAAKALPATGRIPVPNLGVVAPGSIIECDMTLDLDHRSQKWRLYGMIAYYVALVSGFSDAERSGMRDVIDASLLAVPWGALDEAVSHTHPGSIPRVRARMDALQRHRPVFEYLLYRGVIPGGHVAIEQLIARHFGPCLEMWSAVGDPTDIWSRVRSAVDAMDSDNATSVSRERLPAALAAHARRVPDLAGVLEFQDHAWLADRLAQLIPCQLENVEAGDPYGMTGQLHGWKRDLRSAGAIDDWTGEGPAAR